MQKTTSKAEGLEPRVWTAPRIAVTLLLAGAFVAFIGLVIWLAKQITPSTSEVPSSHVERPAADTGEGAPTATNAEVTDARPEVTDTKSDVADTKPGVADTKPGVADTKPEDPASGADDQGGDGRDTKGAVPPPAPALDPFADSGKHFTLTELLAGCEKRHLAACERTGIRYLAGRSGAKKNAYYAKKYFELGCPRDDENAHPGSCHQLGMMLSEGTASRKDLARARALFDFACNRKEATSCAKLANMYNRGQAGLDRDPSRAEELYRVSCELQYAKACKTLYLLIDGREDRDATEEVRRLGCKAGDQQLCDLGK